MSERDTIKCEECRELLTAIACGEINARDEQRARAHTESCPACKATLGAFQHAIWAAAELPLDEPSAALDERVMAAAAAALQKRAPARKARPAWWNDLGATLGRLGDWAMSPQVAMASVLVLVVGIGLYALPLHQPAERSALTTVHESPVAEAPGDLEGTATGFPVPAQEVAAAAEERAAAVQKDEGPGSGARKASGGGGRFAPAPVLPAKKAASAGRAAAPDGADDAFDAKLRSARAREAETEENAAASRVAAKAAPRPAAEPPAPSAPVTAAPAAADEPSKEAVAPLGSLAADGLGSAGAEARRESAADKSEPQGAAPSLESSAAAAQAPAPPASAATASAPAPAKPASERADLAKGMQALTAGKLPQAIAALTPLAQHGSDEVRDLAQSLLAEALHDAGRCKEAVLWYTKVVARPSASARSLELAADCFAKTGREAKAAELRARARGTSKR